MSTVNRSRRETPPPSRLAALLSAGLLVLGGSIVLAQEIGSPSGEPAAGKLLVASRGLLEPNFDRTVVLLVNHSDEGAMGIIINRPTEVRLGELVSDLEGVEEREETVWVGGPVAHWQMVLLIRSKKVPEGAENVFENVHFSASRVVLDQLLAKDTEFRVYAGYAGWTAGQLEHEIARGGWHVLPGEPELIFDPAPLELWRELIVRGEAKWVYRPRPSRVAEWKEAGRLSQ